MSATDTQHHDTPSLLCMLIWHGKDIRLEAYLPVCLLHVSTIALQNLNKLHKAALGRHV